MRTYVSSNDFCNDIVFTQSIMSTPHTSIPLTITSGIAANESDLRSQLFGSQRKAIQPNAVGNRSAAASPNPLHPSENRTQPPSLISKASSPVVKPLANSQTAPIIAADVSSSVSSPPFADGGCAFPSAGVSIESLLEELNRRKTHNVKHICVSCARMFLTPFACFTKKGGAARKRQSCCGRS
jgi:hypothetical protein